MERLHLPDAKPGMDAGRNAALSEKASICASVFCFGMIETDITEVHAFRQQYVAQVPCPWIDTKLAMDSGCWFCKGKMRQRFMQEEAWTKGG